jgi:hypothetical protein
MNRLLKRSSTVLIANLLVFSCFGQIEKQEEVVAKFIQKLESDSIKEAMEMLSVNYLLENKNTYQYLKGVSDDITQFKTTCQVSNNFKEAFKTNLFEYTYHKDGKEKYVIKVYLPVGMESYKIISIDNKDEKTIQDEKSQMKKLMKMTPPPPPPGGW